MTSNPKQISGLNVTTQVRDNTDVVHTGIIKALNVMAGGNKIIDGCDITQSADTGASGGTTLFTVSAGNYMQDNQLVPFAGSTIKLNTQADEFTNPAGIQTPHASNDYYALLVINSAGALKIRGDNTLASATPVVADYTLGDTLLSVIKITGGSPANHATRELQFLTINKSKNAVSVAYNNGGTYTETLSLIGGVGGTEISNKLGNLTIQDGSTGGIIIAGDKVGLGGTAPTKDIHIERNSGTDELVFIKNTSTTGNKGLFIETRGSDTDLAFDITTTGGTSKASIDSTGKIVNAADMELGGNLQVGGNIIKASDGGSTITMDTDDNVTIAGDLTVAGGDILGPTDGALTIKADTDMIFRIDSDSDGAETFQFQTNNGNEVMSLDEGGNLQIDGNLNISGGGLVTTPVTADGLFTTASGLTNMPDAPITNQGHKNEGFGANYGLKAANAPISGSDLGIITKCIQPDLPTALSAPNVITPNHEVIYLGMNDVNQIAEQDAITAGLSPNEYLAFIEGIESVGASNGLFGGGGFVAITGPDLGNRSTQKFTLVNICNVPCYVVSTINNTSILSCWHKGHKTATHTHTLIGHNTVNLSRQLETAAFNAYNSGGFNIPSTGETAYLLRPGCSVTLHATQLSGEEGPTYEVQQFSGFNPSPPNAYWMVKSSSEGTLEGKIINNTHIRDLHLGAPYSGYTVYANYTAHAQSIYLPPVPAIGTQFFIYALADVTVYAQNSTTGYVDTGAITASDVIRDSGADVNNKVMSTGSMATFIYGPDNKWLLVG